MSDRESKVRLLSDLKRELSGREHALDRVGEASLHLVQRGELSDAQRLEELAQEFSDLRGDVAARMDALCKELKIDQAEVEEIIEEDDVDLPPISVNSSIQVNNYKEKIGKFSKAGINDPKKRRRKLLDGKSLWGRLNVSSSRVTVIGPQ